MPAGTAPDRTPPRRRPGARRGLALLLAAFLTASPPVAWAQTGQFVTAGLNFATNGITFAANAITFGASSVTFPVIGLTAPVKETEGEVRFRLSGDVLFDFDKAEIRPEAEAILSDLAARIRDEFGGATVRIEGHTDSKGSDSYNQALSERRARSVARWLADRGGLPSGQMSPGGFGEAQPVAPNEHKDGSDNPEGRQENRRVEIVVER